MEKRNPNDLLILGGTILLLGILLMSYSISTYRETKSLEDKIDFAEIDNNNSMSSSDKYFKYLSIADFLNQKLKKNEGLLMKNSSCVYLDYAQHNALALYRLTYNGMQTEESRRSVAAGNIRNLYSMLDNYKTTLKSKSTVYDLLKKACNDKGITYNSKDTMYSVYIVGINNIDEKDCGKDSGWMYSVNGSFPNVSVDSKRLKDGDKVVFTYTCSYKK